jgi:hypothetical protein
MANFGSFRRFPQHSGLFAASILAMRTGDYATNEFDERQQGDLTQ